FAAFLLRMCLLPPLSTLFPYTTLFRSSGPVWPAATTLPDFRGKNGHVNSLEERIAGCFSFSMNGKAPEYGSDTMLALSAYHQYIDRKSTRLNSSHVKISYAVFCLKKKN